HEWGHEAIPPSTVLSQVRTRLREIGHGQGRVTTRQRVSVRHLWPQHLHTTSLQIELPEESRRLGHGVHGRAEIVHDVLVEEPRAAQATADRITHLVDLDAQPCTCQSHRRGQTVRPASHDHGVKITHAAFSLVLQTWKLGRAPPELSQVPSCRPFDDRRPSTSSGPPCAHVTVADSRRHKKPDSSSSPCRMGRHEVKYASPERPLGKTTHHELFRIVFALLMGAVSWCRSGRAPKGPPNTGPEEAVRRRCS